MTLSFRRVRRLLSIVGLISVACMPMGPAQETTSCRQPVDDDNNYALANARIIREMRVFLDAKTTVLRNDQLQELSDMSNSISAEMEQLAKSPYVMQLLQLNHLPAPAFRKNSYRIVVTNDDVVGAWACQPGSTTHYEMRISTAFFANALLTSMKQAIYVANNFDDGMGMGPTRLNFDDELATPRDVVNAATKLENGPKKNESAESVNDLIVQTADTMGMREDLNELETLATLQYLKLLAFVIGHESSHMWVDGCSENTSETRADDFGFVLSSLLLDEQMLHAMLYNAATLTEIGFRQKYYEFRSVARQHIRNPKAASDDDTESSLGVCYRKWANMSDSELNRRYLALSRVSKRLYASLISDIPPQFRQPISMKGFEMFTQVYEDLGLKEFLAGDAVHPALETRKSRLEGKYSKESDVVTHLFRELMSHSVRLSQKAAEDRSDYIESWLQPVMKPGVCAITPKMKRPNNDPCLSPPPDPKTLDELTSDE